MTQWDNDVILGRTQYIYSTNNIYKRGNVLEKTRILSCDFVVMPGWILHCQDALLPSGCNFPCQDLLFYDSILSSSILSGRILLYQDKFLLVRRSFLNRFTSFYMVPWFFLPNGNIAFLRRFLWFFPWCQHYNWNE